MFSIVIPLYNKQHTIGRTLQSVLQQQYENFEVLIINDGSTDSSLEAVATCSDSRIRIISTENAGVSAARNIGLKHAQYQWIAFLDADDWWDDSFLRVMATLIEQFSEHAIIATSRTHVFQTYEQRYLHKFLPKKGEVGALDHFQVISEGLPSMHTCSTIFNRSLFKTEAPFKIGMEMHEDHELWMRLAVSNSVLFLNSPLAFYNKQNKHSASSKQLSEKDFHQLVATIKEVNVKISAEQKVTFKKYYRRFIVFSFLKNKKHYSTIEKSVLEQQVKSLLTPSDMWLLRIPSFIPLSPLYRWLKRNISS
ncbi:MAG TPA: glycosyltransferase family 2 protein [Flavobacteriaceae bacterium]|jgi:glycosyltransferase involved in cell wall biosynthesis|nr:glycosyltransferase family 2 protein [Flavobacteriaceae bacterium]HIN98602.1 glycosyltransferase family 2 protein [Flavobacteriaceae bacterium]|tara:strand:+ start:108691 stop:109614 length:924 start_codon:yes stop_codon:yes gene_type:complete